MITFISITLILISLGIAGYVFFSVKNSPVITGESEWFSNKEIGKIEKDLVNCQEVILVSDSVRVPSKEDYKEILFALIDNFLEGVEYNFLVEPGFYDKNAKELEDRYQNIINLAKDLSDDRTSTLGTFKLHKYSFEKPEKDYPYLFYRYVTETGANQILAFRGEDIGVGISEYYRRLEPEVAKTILMHALPYIHGQETVNIRHERYGNFVSTDSVIDLEEKKRARG